MLDESRLSSFIARAHQLSPVGRPSVFYHTHIRNTSLSSSPISMVTSFEILTGSLFDQANEWSIGKAAFKSLRPVIFIGNQTSSWDFHQHCWLDAPYIGSRWRYKCFSEGNNGAEGRFGKPILWVSTKTATRANAATVFKAIRHDIHTHIYIYIYAYARKCVQFHFSNRRTKNQ